MNILKIKLLHDDVVVPKKATKGSAGYDICAYLKEPIILKPGETCSINTGFAIELESDQYVAHIYARSGLSTKHGIVLTNSVGIIDSDYRGEIMVSLYNNSDSDFKIENNDRIAQMVIHSVFSPKIEIVNELSDTKRNIGGFGSTGLK